MPTELAVAVYEMLIEAGQEFGIANAGYYSINSLRLEKGYRAFGSELTPEHNPVEAGLLFACKLKTEIDFLGRAAVEQARQAGPRRRLASFVLRDPEVMMWGGELLLRDGVPVGQVSSAAWASTTGACVGLAYVRGPEVNAQYLASGDWQLDVAGHRAAASVSLKAPYDPDSRRIRG